MKTTQENKFIGSVRPNRGIHLMGSLVHCDPERLKWEKGIKKLLEHFPKKVGMELIPFEGNPCVKRTVMPTMVEANHPMFPKDSGVSGFCLLWESITGYGLCTTSHTSLHTWVEYRELDFDVFSCLPFNFEKALKIFKYFFRGVPDISVIVVDRSNGSVIYPPPKYIRYSSQEEVSKRLKEDYEKREKVAAYYRKGEHSNV